MLRKLNIEIEYEDYSEERNRELLLGALLEKTITMQSYTEEDLVVDKYAKIIQEIICISKRLETLEKEGK